MIETQSLRREFGKTLAVADVSLRVDRGSVFALVGPNGAGKTTLLKMICGLLEPTSGTAVIDGLDIQTHPRRVQEGLGFLPDFFGLYDDLRVWEYLEYFARAYRLSTADRKRRLRETLAEVNLTDRADVEIRTLSRGMRQRLAIARTLIHDPPLLLLDEPAAGLDPESRHDLQFLFSALASAGKTLVVSSHILSELEEYCTHVAILRAGRMVASGSIEEVRRSLNMGKRIRLKVLDHEAKAREILNAEPAIHSVAGVGTEMGFVFQGDEPELARILDTLVHANVTVIFFGEERRTIEDTYLTLTRQEEQSK